MTGSVFEFGAKGLPPAQGDGRLDAPAFHRNVEPIWNAIGGDLSAAQGAVLEIGSGTGQHAVTYAARTPQLTWWPSDIVASHRDSIEAYRRISGPSNLRPPQSIDLMRPDWDWHGDEKPLSVILCFNVIHISPWTVTENLMRGAARHLPAGGLMFLYGPYKRDGAHTAPSNADFDASLRARNPEWGVRDIADVTALAHGDGMALRKIIEMLANNLVLAFERH